MMTKQEIKEAKKLVSSLKGQIEQLEDLLLKEVKETPVVNTNLTNRNYDVFICRQYLYMSYDDIANALHISRAQVGESLKVLRDRGLIETSRKKPTLVDKNIKAVRAMQKKGYSRPQMASKLGVSEKTIIRCLERINA